jgi:hypothetical protein
VYYLLREDQWFYFAGGRVARDIHELIHCLKEISTEEFIIHVNSSKNDFANWVEGVFGYGDLAYEMRHVLEKRDTTALLRRFLYMQKSHSEDQVKKDIAEGIKISTEELKFVPEKVEKHEEPVLKVHAHPDYHPNNEESFQDALHDASMSIEHDHEEHADLDIKVKTEHDLEDDDLRHIAEDASQEIHIEGRMIEDRKRASEVQHINNHLDYHKFIVKEFIYGFFLGMIFGLMMLGALYNIG